MREVLFRARAINREEGRVYRTNYKNGDWVYGLLTDKENYLGFAEMTNTNGVSRIDVDKNTIGQYTGLTDKNGNKIFEGDIVKVGEDYNYLVPDFSFGVIDPLRYWKTNQIEVIGNIHDNPELLEGE